MSNFDAKKSLIDKTYWFHKGFFKNRIFVESKICHFLLQENKNLVATNLFQAPVMNANSIHQAPIIKYVLTAMTQTWCLESLVIIFFIKIWGLIIIWYLGLAYWNLNWSIFYEKIQQRVVNQMSSENMKYNPIGEITICHSCENRNPVSLTFPGFPLSQRF